MRLSFVLSSLRLSGGVQVVVEYANRLARRGYSVSLVAPHNTIDDEIGSRISSAVAICESPLTLQPQAGLVQQTRLVWSLTQTIPSNDVMVATHTPTIVPVILRTLKRRRHRMWLYMDYSEMFADRPIERWLLKSGPRWFDQIVTLSEAGRQDAMRSGARRASVAGLGLTDAELFKPLASTKNRGDHIVMYLGDARPRKGMAEFLAAMEIVHRHISDLRALIVIKDGTPIRTSVPCEIVVRPPREALPSLYQRCDVLAFPSWGEGFGLPPLEAMACGVPVIVADSRGVREYARHEENCLMFPPRDVDQLAKALVRILNDARLARELSAAGVMTASKFQWDVCVDRFEAALSALE